jgi:hypothetical protein
MLPSQHRHPNGMQSEIIDGIRLMTTSRRETFTFRAGTVTPKLFAWVFDHKTLAKDKLLGEGEIEVSVRVHNRYTVDRLIVNHPTDLAVLTTGYHVVCRSNH